MRAARSTGPSTSTRHRRASGRHPERLAVAVLGLAALLAAVWLAVVGRRAATAATPVSAGSAAAGSAAAGSAAAGSAAAGSAAAGSAAAPAAGTRVPDAVTELTRVSGLGRRSAEALVAGGITSLAALAERTDDELAAVLDAAGVTRSTTLSTWPNQARHLGEG